MRKHICFILLLLSLCAACKQSSVQNKNTEQKQPETEQEVEIQGEVFVVTKGAQNIKLGLVDVIAIPEDQITTYLENKKREADTRRTELESASIRAESEYFKAQSDLDRARIQSREVMRLYEELIEKISKSRSYGYSPTQTQAEAVAEKGLYAMREKMNQLESQLDLKKLELERAKLKLEGWPTSAFIFSGLPSSIGRASTNADGKFSLKLPRKGKYALAAHASRKIIDDDEQYHWLIWVAAENGAVKNVVLSNNNMMTVQSAENVMYTALSDF